MTVDSRGLRSICRQLLVTCWPGPIRATKRIAIVGLPRSGTSWLGKAVSLASNVHYYFEPDQNFDKSIQFPYLDKSENNNELFAHISSTYRGKLHNEYTIAEQGLREIVTAPFADVVLIKWVRFPLCLEWIGENFPDIKMVQIIRHPVPLVLSWKTRGWDPAWGLKKLLNQPELIDGPLHPYKETMAKANTFWGKAAAFWSAITYIQLKAHRESWILKEHEWYCERPIERIHWLITELGLEWNSKIEKFLSEDRKRKSGPGYGQNRDSKCEITKWHGKIQGHELKEVSHVVEKFDLPFYPELTAAAVDGINSVR